MAKEPRERAAEIFVPTVFTRDDLHAAGYSGRQVTAAVRSGRLTRLRRDRYVRGVALPDVEHAARLGGRVTCVSLLRMLGVFVLDAAGAHVHVARNRSRFRDRAAEGCRLHWGVESASDLRHVTTLDEAVLLSVRCQEARAAVATLDSLVHHGLITLVHLETIFRALPERFQVLLRLVDPSAASGPETLVRLMLRSLPVTYEAQVRIQDVGIVDFVVDGWLIIECDSKEFHEGWDKQQQDRRRDIAAARLGYVTVRPLATDILYKPASVRESLSDVIGRLGPLLMNSRSQIRKNVR